MDSYELWYYYYNFCKSNKRDLKNLERATLSEKNTFSTVNMLNIAKYCDKPHYPSIIWGTYKMCIPKAFYVMNLKNQSYINCIKKISKDEGKNPKLSGGKIKMVILLD